MEQSADRIKSKLTIRNIFFPRSIAGLPTYGPKQPRQISDPEVHAPARQVDGQASRTASHGHWIVKIEIEQPAGQKESLRRRRGRRRWILLNQFERPDLARHRREAATFADALERVDHEGDPPSFNGARQNRHNHNGRSRNSASARMANHGSFMTSPLSVARAIHPSRCSISRRAAARPAPSALTPRAAVCVNLPRWSLESDARSPPRRNHV